MSDVGTSNFCPTLNTDLGITTGGFLEVLGLYKKIGSPGLNKSLGPTISKADWSNVMK